MTQHIYYTTQDVGVNLEEVLQRQWLVANGLGGYASSTLAGINTWHYHGLLVSSEPAPLGRVLSLAQVVETITLSDGRSISLEGEARQLDHGHSEAKSYLTKFRMEAGLPVWTYDIEGVVLERSILMPYRQNTTYIIYRVLQADGVVKLSLSPRVSLRLFEALYNEDMAARLYTTSIVERRYEISGVPGFPVLRLFFDAEHFSFSTEGIGRHEMYFRHDAERGLDARGISWAPGQFSADLAQGKDAALIASTEPWANIEAIPYSEVIKLEGERRTNLLSAVPKQLRAGLPAELVIAADSFIIQPAGRLRERIRALATGENVRSIIAGYHWFTDWGRDTMISLEGLTLVTGRIADARSILISFNRYIRDGLIPNMFPEGSQEGLYHTVDATLWYFHAIDRYLSYTQDKDIIKTLLPSLLEIIQHHIKGTHFGIRVDSDGLLRQGEEGYQLTWMDAKFDNLVVTPRRGKAVEINGLWYNALCLLAEWVEEEQGAAAALPWREEAAKTYEAFNKRFWYGAGGYLYDVIDGEHGDDTSCRPNQLLAFSLGYPVLEEARRAAVLKIVQEKLLTPLGLRTLAPDHPDYKPTYFGDLRSRDAAYHQGTVWPWLIGPFIDAWLATNPQDVEGARGFLKSFETHIDNAGIGFISEICDAEMPHTPRGCIAQAWSVAEVLRSWAKTNIPVSEKSVR